jgi:hypothetical protein
MLVLRYEPRRQTGGDWRNAMHGVMLRWKESPEQVILDYRARGKTYSRRFAFTVSEPGNFEHELRNTFALAMQAWQEMCGKP